MGVDPVLVRRLADEAGYQAATLEKVARLEDLPRETARHPRLGEHLALKGGTAINFVLLPEAPRLSVDIDLNYLGEVGREEMLADRPAVEEALERIFEAQGYRREPPTAPRREPFGTRTSREPPTRSRWSSTGSFASPSGHRIGSCSARSFQGTQR